MSKTNQIKCQKQIKISFDWTPNRWPLPPQDRLELFLSVWIQPLLCLRSIPALMSLSNQDHLGWAYGCRLGRVEWSTAMPTLAPPNSCTFSACLQRAGQLWLHGEACQPYLSAQHWAPWSWILRISNWRLQTLRTKFCNGSCEKYTLCMDHHDRCIWKNAMQLMIKQKPFKGWIGI